MSKFFTDYSKTHTFSLDKVVAFKKGIQLWPSLENVGDDMLLPTIEVTLSSDGSLHNINLIYWSNDEFRRDLDFDRLCEDLRP